MGDPNTSNVTLMVTGGLLGSAMGAAYSPWMANYSENAEDVDPRLQGTAFGLFSFVIKVILVFVLIIAPLVVAAANWQTWIIVSAVCMALFGIASIFFKGPWLNAKKQPPTGAAVTDAATPVKEIPPRISPPHSPLRSTTPLSPNRSRSTLRSRELAPVRQPETR